ncbi:fimbrillin family protein [Sphingobacterium spiritivorum]|uniref:fimbrillin family protein n=1 Tax=Sphingobacterium spiritivorum TaxID=258 RepID=UPI00191A6728|nr:fimbrillin family protein [Sphingobacterium spiritivorum]QQT25873.1 fimbrillin family protein [Sphingobacterium spiritivorum]
MKTIHTKKTMIWTQLILCGLLTLSSCSKKETEKQIPPDQVTQLSFAVNGIAEASDAGAATSSRSAVPVSNTARESQLLDLGGINAMISVTSGPIKAQEISTNNSKQRAANMTNGYKYRVVVLDAATGAVVGSVEAIASSTGQQTEAAKIDVVKGGSYKWYAYSYNEAATVTPLLNEANPIFTPSYDKDLLIANGTVLVPGTAGSGPNTETQVPITFKHALAKVTVRFDASSRSDAISALNATLGSATYFNKGTVSLNTTDGTLTYTITGQHNVSSINVTLPGTIASASYYTIPVTPTATAIPSFKVNVASLTVGPLSTTNKTVDFTNTILPVAGKEEIANINILDVTPIGTTYWATGNLYYENNTYKIRDEDVIPRPIQSISQYIKTDGWNWMANLPYPNVFDQNNLIDPCKKVLPLNTWRMPRRTEFEALLPLANSSDTYEEKQSFIPTAATIGYNRFRQNANSKWVQFNFDGNQIAIGGTTGNYWTTDNTKLGNSYFRAAALYVVHNSDPTVPDQLLSGMYYNIRCVLNR